MDRDEMAFQLYCALIDNPERYKYIAEKVETGLLDNNAATAKNINKAYKMADQFIESANISTEE